MPISAPFALHHLPGTGGPALPAFWSGLRHSCSASDTEGLRIETHGGANERDLKHANAATRAELDPHRVRSGVRLLRGWKMSKTFLDRAGVATARGRRCCDSGVFADRRACARKNAVETKLTRSPPCPPVCGKASAGLSGTVSCFPSRRESADYPDHTARS